MIEDYFVGQYHIIIRPHLEHKGYIRMEIFQVVQENEHFLEGRTVKTRLKAIRAALAILPEYGQKWGWE